MIYRPAAESVDLAMRHEVIEAIDTLFIATDEKDWATVRECFAEQVQFDMSSAGGGAAGVRTGAEIAAGWEQGLAPIQAVHHQAGNYRVTVGGDRAKASCHGIAYHYLPNPSGRNTRTFVGTYALELRREPDRWRITSFRYNLKFVDGNLELEKSG